MRSGHTENAEWISSDRSIRKHYQRAGCGSVGHLRLITSIASGGSCKQAGWMVPLSVSSMVCRYSSWEIVLKMVQSSLKDISQQKWLQLRTWVSRSWLSNKSVFSSEWQPLDSTAGVLYPSGDLYAVKAAGYVNCCSFIHRLKSQ